MKLFDFNGFEKVAEDKHKTTMRHKDGHEIHIAHSVLPPVKQEQLRRLTMAKGGQVSKDALSSGEGGVSEQGRAVRKAHKTNDKSEMSYAKEEARGRADYERIASHPDVKGFDEGGQVQQPIDRTKNMAGGTVKGASGADIKDPTTWWADGGRVQNFDEGSPSTVQADVAQPAPAPPPVIVNVGQPNPYANAPGMQGAQNNQPQQGPQQPYMPQSPGYDMPKTNVPEAPPNNVQSALNSNGTPNPAAAERLGEQGINQGLAADTSVAQGMQQALPEQRKAIQNQADFIQKNINDFGGHTNAIADYDRNQPFNENAYWQNMKAPTMFANALGLLAGGFKQGLVGGNNPAMDFIDKQVEQNIDGQKQRFQNQKTIYGFYKDLYGAGNTSAALARISTRDLMQNDADQLAAKAGPGKLQGAANLLKANFAVKNEQDLKNAVTDITAHPGYHPVGGQPSSGATQPAARPNQGAQRGVGKPPDQSAQPSAMDAIKGGFNGADKSKKTPDEEWADSPILAPDAEKRVTKSQFGIYADQFKDNQDALNRAKAADRVLGQLHGAMENLHTNAKMGGKDEYDVRKKSLARIVPSLEVGGSHIGGTNLQALAERDSDSQTMREYSGTRTRIVTDIANATKGTGLGQEEIQKIVDANLPEYNDSNSDMLRKERNIKLAIKNAFVESKGLSNLGALNEKKK